MTKFASALLLFAFAHQILAVPLPNEIEEQKEFRVPIKSPKLTNAANSSLKPEPDVFSMYMVSSVTVGTAKEGEKAQEMGSVIFTLASGDFWVQDYTARQAKRCPYNMPVDTFNPEYSATFHPTDLTFETNSYKGKVNGTVGVDNVQIADGLVAENARIGQATNYHCYFIEYMNSGVLGLGLPALGNPNISHASPVLKAVSKLPNPLFTIKINPETEEGSITFGSLNPSECANQWKFASLSPSTNGFWQVQTSSFDIGTHKHEKPQQAILLESIPSILGQIEDIDRLIVEIPSAEYSKSTRSIVVTKKAVEEGKLPVIRFQLANGVELALSPKDYVVDYTFSGYCPTVFSYKADYIDTPRLPLPGNLTGVNWVFGRPIMSKFCTSYDFGKKQIGFALAKDENSKMTN